MLTIEKDEQGNSTSYQVTSVTCENVDNNPARRNIFVKTPDKTIEIYVYSDLNLTAEKAAERIRKSVDGNIIIRPAKRDYLYLSDASLPEGESGYQIKASGRIEKE